MTRPCAIPAALCLILWLSASGCVLTRMPGPGPRTGFATEHSKPGKSAANSFDHPSVEPPSEVRQAAAQSVSPPVASPLPPRVEQSPAIGPSGVEYWHPGLPQLPRPGDAVDPHTRATPTVGGALLNLQPGESATDRVVGLAREVGLLTAQLDLQQSRIRELEAAAATREQALLVASRELDALRGDAADVAKARAETAAALSELLAAKERLRKVQVEELEMLRQVIGALERLLPPRRDP